MGTLRQGAGRKIVSTLGDLIKQAHAMTAQEQDYRLWDNAVI